MSSAIEANVGKEAEKLREAEKKVAAGAKSLDDLAKKKKELRSIMDLQQKDFEYYRDCHDLELMRERKGRVDEARTQAKGAGTVLEKVRIGEDELEEIIEAEGELHTAKAGLERGAPSLHLKSLSDIDLELDGERFKLKSGKERVESVTEEVMILLPDILEIKVAPGTSSKGLSRQFEEAEESLSSLLKKYGVSDRADAKKQIQARKDAESQIEAVKKAERENLRDLTYEELTERMEGLETRTAGYLKARSKTIPITGDLDSSRKAQEKTEKSWDEVEQDFIAADQAHTDTEDERNKVSGKVSNVEGQLSNARKELADATSQLKEARKSVSDGKLEQGLTDASNAVAQKSGMIGLKHESLSKLNPVQVRALVQNTADSLQTAEGRLRGLLDEKIDLKARLTLRGEEGLHENIQLAEGDLFRKHRDNRSLFRRAAAARLLHSIMTEEQGKAHERYKAPFKGKVEQLGRLVYNDTFEVVMGEGLTINDRKLNERTVPFDSLSGGAKEQLAILARIAAAILVSDDKPVPVIIDDALGYTDPGRLKLMGTALAQAGKTGQVLILTCTPERYAHLGKVEVVSIRPAVPGDK